MTHQTHQTIEAFIRDAYYQNFELLRHESGSSLSPETREAGLNQVLLYWMRLRDVAERVTDAEVRINLPNQRSPQGRLFGIEGVVDIIREDDKTVMYDIKTHDADYVRQNLDLYAMQLSLYAYVWQQLRGQPIDATAIIAIVYPEEVRDAIPPGKIVSELTPEEWKKLEAASNDWQPLIEIDFTAASVQEAIHKFGEVVDCIENHQFAPPTLEQLKTVWQPSKELFATRVCRNCDARFSCTSYRAYAQKRAPKNWRLVEFAQYFYDDFGDEAAQEDWLAANLNAAPDDAYLDALLGE